MEPSKCVKFLVPLFAVFMVILALRTMGNGPAKRSAPTMEECLRIIEQVKPYPNIADHMRKVHEIAMDVVSALEPGVRKQIDYDLVAAASLLHDIGKMESLTTDESHLVVGGRIMRKLGYPLVAEIIEDHELEKSFDPDGPLLEKEIVCFGDTRGMGSRTVGLATRMLDLYERYDAKNNRDLALTFWRSFERYRLLEKKIRRSILGELEDVVPDDTVYKTILNPLETDDVRVVGDFNFWIPEKVDGISHTVRVPPGKYYYNLLLSDGRSAIDPAAPSEYVPGSKYNTSNYFVV